MPFILGNTTADGVHAGLAHLGVTPRAARQIQAAVIRRGALPEAGPSGLPENLLERVSQATVIPRLTRVEKTVSPRDGFAKYLFQGNGPDPFESVCIPLLHRPDDKKCVVCVSCQVGCSLGCVFCATGRMGFRRDLAAWEIVDQVAHIQADTPLPVRGVVFMGMGEPMLNYDAVIQAARIMSEPCGMAISAKAITVSTAGILPGIRRFTEEGQPFRLVVSLTSADPVQRRALMPVEQAHPLPELMDAICGYQKATGKRVTLAWTMMAGVNTREEDARQLAALTKGLPVKLDLIDVNDPTGRFQPPSPEELNAFRDALRKHLAMPVARRYSGGQDIDGACGMLAQRMKTSTPGGPISL
jgi:23S rRNA (adenine2503-C2)-methyltransferase